METQVENVFVKVDQVWQRGEVFSKEGSTLKIKTSRHPEIKMDEESRFVEPIKSKAQQYAYLEVEERLDGAYISLKNLPEATQKKILDILVKGKEYFYHSTYVYEGEFRESMKAVQMIYNRQTGSKLDVQIKRNEPVTLSEAKAYNYQFTQEEFDMMVKERKQVLFTGSSTDGELFSKLAYYEPKLNDIRTKAALSENSLFYGQKLTKDQATTMNKGELTKITINSQKGKKIYMATYNPRFETFYKKNLEKDNIKNIETKDAIVVGKEKKKNQRNVMSK